MHPNCRIGKIKLRNGAEVRVLDSYTHQAVENCRRAFTDAANATLDSEQAMAGFFMVAWGGQTVTDHLRVMENSKRGIYEIPSFVKEVASQRVTSKLASGAHDAGDGNAG